MPRISRRAAITLAVMALGVMAVAIITAMSALGSRKPLEQQMLCVDHLEYIGEACPADGGSCVFFFHTHPPHRKMLALMVRHRKPEFGGNANFQEIWLDRGGNFGAHTEVSPGSALESELLQLLPASTIDTNRDLQIFPKPANLDRLKWVTERITDRKTKW